MSLLANQRARSATEIVDASVRFLRAHAIPLYTIAALVTIPPAVIKVFVPEGVQILIGFAENLLFPIGGAAVSVYATSVMTEGESSVGAAFRGLSGRFWKVIAAQIAFNIAVFLGLLLVVIPGLIFAVRCSLAPTVAALEKTSNSNKALERSWALTKGHSMHVLGTLLLCVGISVLVVLGGSFLLGLAAAAVGLEDSSIEILVTLLMLLVSPFVWMALTLLYIDLRVRVEGADLEAMVASLPASPAGASPNSP